MTDIIDTITQAIDRKYHLRRQNEDWLIQGQTTIQVRSPRCHSIGFSLDSPSPKPLAFFSKSPPRHLAKMCDAMIAVLDKQKLYLFAIEVKTRNKNDSDKQLANGRHFWRWLMALCCQHGYLCTEPVYIAVLVWQPQKQVRKGATTHQGANGIYPSSQSGFDAAFEVTNQNLLRLRDLIERAAGI